MGRDRVGVEAGAEGPGRTWPAWARRLATVALAVHLVALVAGGLGEPPSSPLERRVADLFLGYYGLLNQGASYRFYAPEPPPTPVAIARLEYADGRPTEDVRLPDRSLRPRLRFQRQLALARHLAVDVEEAREAGDERGSLLARSYARHLCRTRGCARVTLFLQVREIPGPDRVREALEHPRTAALDVDAEESAALDRIGDYACDAF